MVGDWAPEMGGQTNCNNFQSEPNEEQRKTILKGLYERAVIARPNAIAFSNRLGQAVGGGSLATSPYLSRLIRHFNLLYIPNVSEKQVLKHLLLSLQIINGIFFCTGSDKATQLNTGYLICGLQGLLRLSNILTMDIEADVLLASNMIQESDKGVRDLLLAKQFVACLEKIISDFAIYAFQ